MVEPAPIDAHERARAWALALLDDAPWFETRTRAALLLVSPPQASWLTPAQVDAAHPAAWLVVDRIDVRALPPVRREPLAKDGVVVQSMLGGELVVIVFEALELLLDTAGRRALEARWAVGHAASLHDPLRRVDGLRRAASVLPRDGEERVLRPLYLQLAEAIRGLATGGLPAAGEAAAAVYRLATVLEQGVHAPIEWLDADGAEAELVVRLRLWLQDLAALGQGDEAARRRVLTAAPGVLRTFADPLRQRLGAVPWLNAPLAYSLRPPR